MHINAQSIDNLICSSKENTPCKIWKVVSADVKKEGKETLVPYPSSPLQRRSVFWTEELVRAQWNQWISTSSQRQK